MRIGVRRKVFLTVFATIFVVITVTGTFLANYFERSQFDRVVDELQRHANSAGLVIESTRHISTFEMADRVADRLGKATDARVSIIQRDGTIIGDSKLEVEQLRATHNQLDQEEVKEALKGRLGHANRYSNSLRTRMLYVAIPYDHNSGQGVVRVSRSTSDISESVSVQLRTLVLVAGLIGLAIAILTSAISSQLLSRTLNTLVRFAKDAAGGIRKKPIEVSTEDELGGLAGSLNQLAEQVELHVTALAEERDRFEAVLNGMNDAVLALDENLKVTLINKAAVLLLDLGYGPTGQSLLETIRVPELHNLVGEVSRDKNGESTAEFELPGDEARRILARATSRRTGGVVVVLQDVTELRRLETLRRDFVSNVSHELRTPVSIMSANAETLLGGAIQDPKAAERFLTTILSNAERLSNLIADLLDISQIEAGRYELNMEPVSISLAMKRAAAALETHAIEKNFNIKVDPSDDMIAMADIRALDQILFNFTDNAVKYAGEGGNVVLRARAMNGKLRIEVQDNGPGVEPKYRDRLFERFYRVDPGRSRKMGGTGLGLAIVKHLATALEGEVGMEPAVPNGSIFWLMLNRSA